MLVDTQGNIAMPLIVTAEDKEFFEGFNINATVVISV